MSAETTSSVQKSSSILYANPSTHVQFSGIYTQIEKQVKQFMDEYYLLTHAVKKYKHCKKRKRSSSARSESRDAEPKIKSGRHSAQQSSPNYYYEDMNTTLRDLYMELNWAYDDIMELRYLHKHNRAHTVERGTKLLRRGLDMLVGVLNKTENFMQNGLSYMWGSCVESISAFNSRPQHIIFPKIVETVRCAVMSAARIDSQQSTFFKLRNENQHVCMVHVVLEPLTDTYGKQRFCLYLVDDDVPLGKRMLEFWEATQTYLSNVASYLGGLPISDE